MRWAEVNGSAATQQTRHFREGELQPAAAALAVCRYRGEVGCYLFHCDENWQVQNDTYHDSVEAAKEQAEFEFQGFSAAWQTGGG